MDSVDTEVRRDFADGAEVHGRTSLPPELRTFWVASLIALVLAILVCWAKYRLGEVKYNWDPLSDPLFGDLREYPGTYSLLHTREFFFNFVDRPWVYPMYGAVAYPPLAAALMAPIYCSGQPELVFLIISAIWIGALIWWTWRKLTAEGIGHWTALLLPTTLALSSFPILRLVHQGNIELVLWVFTALGAWAFWQSKNGVAARLWGLAAAMKLFPAVLLILLLPRKQYRAFSAGVASFFVSSLVSMWWLGPSVGVAWQGTMKNVFGYQSMRVAEFNLRELIANHSLIDVAKIVALIAHFPLTRLVLPYYVLGAVAFAAAFFGKLWRMPPANQLLGVSAFMVMFPPISYYHALVHMYAPLIVLGCVAFRAAKAGVPIHGLRMATLLFVPLFVPFPLLMFPRVFVYCGVVQSMALLLLFLYALEHRFEAPGTQAAAD